jgi:hypothetical protein
LRTESSEINPRKETGWITQAQHDSAGIAPTLVSGKETMSPAVNALRERPHRLQPQAKQPLIASEVEKLPPVFAGQPPIQIPIQPVQYAMLTSKELADMGIVIEHGLIKIHRRLPQKDSNQAALAIVCELPLEQMGRTARPALLAPPIIAPIATFHHIAANNLRPFMLTDTLGHIPPMLMARTLEDSNKLRSWSPAFRVLENTRPIDSTMLLVGIRPQPHLQRQGGLASLLGSQTVSAQAHHYNVVLWYRLSPALLAVLPARLREQLRNEKQILSLAQASEHYQEQSKEPNKNEISSDGSNRSSAYYMGQTQSVIPRVLILHSSLLRTRRGGSLSVGYTLDEVRTLYLTLHYLNGATIGKAMTVANAQTGLQRIIYPIASDLKPGLYMIALRSERYETAIQYVLVE